MICVCGNINTIAKHLIYLQLKDRYQYSVAQHLIHLILKVGYHYSVSQHLIFDLPNVYQCTYVLIWINYVLCNPSDP
jgi:hypothetical protein